MSNDADNVSLSPLSYQILLALTGHERHGYLIRKAVEQQSEGRLRPGPGSVYAAIRRLEDEGLIEEATRRPHADLDDERRRYYRLTRDGRTALHQETERLRATIAFATRQLKLHPAS